MPQTGWILDLERCTGCKSCTLACKMENNIPAELFYRWVVDRHWDTVPASGAERLLRFVSMTCFHCANPACVPSCPVFVTPDADHPDGRAINKDPSDGIVRIDQDLCIGCCRCSAACPYGAPQYNPETNKVEKCTFCSHRLAAGLGPACVETCVGRALGYASPVAPGGAAPTGFANTSMTNPSVQFA